MYLNDDFREWRRNCLGVVTFPRFYGKALIRRICDLDDSSYYESNDLCFNHDY